jgi:hypothetical protein
LKGIKTQETRYRGDSKAVKDKPNVILEGQKHHLVVEIPGKVITPTTHPYCSDCVNHLREANLEESANKKEARKILLILEASEGKRDSQAEEERVERKASTN